MTNSTKKTAKTVITSYLGRCKNPAPTSRILNTVGNSSGYSHSTLTRALQRLKTEGTVLRANDGVGGTPATWILATNY